MKRLYFAILFLHTSCFASYLIGAGTGDVTGPAAEVGMMGYAKLDQKTNGIHTRLHSRAFVFVDTVTEKRVVFVSADLGHIFQAVKRDVVIKLQEKFGNLYTDENVMLSATHTHSGPGGYGHEILFNITTLGFISENYNVIVNGIFDSIVMAHNNLQSGEVFINRGELTNVSKNRSLTAYQNNPENEKAQYSYPFETRMTLLRLQGHENGNAIGTVNWFSLHGVSMSNLNTLISADNKGYASSLFEKIKQKENFNNQNFVAAFAQSNEGDISPNIDNFKDDPISHDFVRTQEAGLKQYNIAKELYENAQEKLEGSIDYRHAYIDMSRVAVQDSVTQISKTSSPSLGYSFAAGTSDGAGSDLFHQGTLASNPFIDAVTGIISQPTYGLKELQFPKPILLCLAQAIPRPWTNSILPIQMFRIGHFVLVGVPAEFTTMSGRRLRSTIRDVFGDDVKDIVIAGLSNAYSGYVTTEEEYNTQNYEGGFTLFGPKTLEAYQKEFKQLAYDLKNNQKSKSASMPEDQSKHQFTLQTGVVFDDVPVGKKFGQVVQQPFAEYQKNDTVTARFWGGHPKNNLKQGGTFVLVEKKEHNEWRKVADDNDWNTIYKWTREGVSFSKITTTWNIPEDVEPGEYRIRHFGDYKNGWNHKIYSYEGISKSFLIK